MQQYLVLKGGSKTFKFRFEGKWSVIVDDTDDDGKVTLQLDFPNEEDIKEIDVIMSYAFKGDKDEDHKNFSTG